MLRPGVLFGLVWSCVAHAILAQGTAADYARAKELPGRWRELGRSEQPSWQWGNGDPVLWWRQSGRGGAARFCVVAADGTVRRGVEAAALPRASVAERLAPGRGGARSGGSDVETVVTFENRLTRVVRLFWIDGSGEARPYGELQPGAVRELSTYNGHVWLGDFAANDLAGVFTASSAPGQAVFDEASVAAARPAPRRERESRLFVRDGNVFGRGSAGDVPLSTDGSAEDPYHEPRHGSPDRSKVLGFQIAPAEPHPVTLVESAPKDQLQPKVHVHDYLKPGDRVARPRPRLFDVQAGRQIPIDDAPFADAWSIDHVHWAADSSEVYCLYNQRGHQLLRVLAIDAVTGAVRTVLEERSATFVDYSQKTVLHWLDGERAFLWASERDGWNHLYRVDCATGAMVQLTHGDFVVRRLEHVDVERREVWFAALGIHPEQDPYHVHLARVGFDGQGLAVLTDGDGTHEWTFSPDRAHFVDRWSRVDLPWRSELRDARSGKLLAELTRNEPQELLAAGFRAPQRFVAKGRDGTTDIHGIVILPSNFEPTRRYPIVEDIYAGPHDHFVPKRWGLGLRQRNLAELGFAVVQIDGMGTNWRRKSFHDVCWRNLADAGLPDRIAWIQALAAARPELDATRVGIFGGSAGGQSALAALLHHGDFYRAAVADCGCHDNRMDKVWWNEAWMGYPIGPWYAANSNVTHAAKLQGKLLLTVGELDRNVDPASTRQVVAALIAADKDFDFVEVPGAGHGIGEGAYLQRRRQDFFVRHLLGVEPRR